MKEFACICIPARLHSSRLDQKLLYKLGNITIIELTIQKCLETGLDIYLLTDSQEIMEKVQNYRIKSYLTTGEYSNGTERIASNLDLIDSKYKFIINVQADEPLINPKNILYALEKHSEMNDPNVFYTTLHQEIKGDQDLSYLQSTACLKLITDSNNNVLYYSRAVIPWNKNGKINPKLIYKTFTGIYVFNRELLSLYPHLESNPAQIEEDIEQLKILGSYQIKSFPTLEFNEISVNTLDDFNFLKQKYGI